jgi:hypothetical protein
MRKFIQRTIALAGLLFVVAFASVQAQVGYTVHADIPFDFVVGEVTFKSGEYTLNQYTPQTLLVRTWDNQTGQFARTAQPMAAANGGTTIKKLVFERLGDQYLLAQVRIGSGSGRDGTTIDISDAKRRLSRAREVTRLQARPEIVEIAAR